MFSKLDFSRAPFLVIWEMTRACDLVCRHCRASAVAERHHDELTIAEGRHLLEEIHAMGTSVVVLSGGDPLKRQDLLELVRYGADLGLRMATIPAATGRVTPDLLSRLKDAGLAQIAFSLDASEEAVHDGFRQVRGTYQTTLKAIEWAQQVGLPVQINTTYARCNISDLDAMIGLITRLNIVFWEVFLLIPIGRGHALEGLTAGECEALLHRLYDCSTRSLFLIKVTEAPHYRRVVIQCRANSPHMVKEKHDSSIPAQLAAGMKPSDAFGRQAKGINAAQGFCFVSHTGEVYPSGFLPLPAGNVRHSSLASLYRDSELFRTLRDPTRLKGRCGSCEFRAICGGSRSRAYAVSGDVLAEDPSCVYIPHRLRNAPEQAEQL